VVVVVGAADEDVVGEVGAAVLGVRFMPVVPVVRERFLRTAAFVGVRFMPA
jgi:hypothetical protein